MLTTIDQKNIEDWFKSFTVPAVGGKFILDDSYTHYYNWSITELNIPSCSKRTFFKVFRQIIENRFKEGQVKFERNSKIFVRGLKLVPEGNIYYQGKFLGEGHIK